MGENRAPDSEVRAELERVALETLAHAEAGAIPYADQVMRLEAAAYADPSRFERELSHLFRRVPLMLALSCELPEPGAYKTIEIAGVPVLLTRARDGAAQAMLNACTHRGSFVANGCGKAARLTCPFHGWTFDLQGKLIGVASRDDFGEVDAATHGLRHFPVLEKAGMIWAVLDPDSPLDIAAFLGPFAAQTEALDLASWHVIDTRTLAGPNWKLAFDAHIDWYHLPVLHRDSFGPNVVNRTLYAYYGPHLRMLRPQAENPSPPETVDPFKLDRGSIADWPLEALVMGGWIVFPNTSFYTVYPHGKRMLNLNQILPGRTVEESVTVQMTLSRAPPDEATRKAGLVLANKVETVVRDEDLATSARQQRTLVSGLSPGVCFGRNEGGNQHFHRWIERVVTADAASLPGLFAVDPKDNAVRASEKPLPAL